jgi:nitric oxide dioxygenase
MTPEQIAQVQQSFAKVAPVADEAAALFYGRLFEIAPELRSLFRHDMAEQGGKLMATLAVVVNGLTRLDAILPAASALAKRHVAYGVRADHYQPVGAALLWTLERSLGTQWTPDLERAWTAAYATLASYMTGEAYDDRSASPCGSARAPDGRPAEAIPATVA